MCAFVCALVCVILIHSILSEDKYREILKKFLASPFREREFEAGLSSWDRMIIHELCEHLGLEHASTGEGAERHIVVRKPAQAASEAGESEALPADVGADVVLAAGAAALPPQQPAEQSAVDVLRDVRRDPLTSPAGGADAVAPAQLEEEAEEEEEDEEEEEGGEEEEATAAAQEADSKLQEAARTQVVSIRSAGAAAPASVPGLVRCSLCEKDIPGQNYDIHRVRCERAQRLASSAKDVELIPVAGDKALKVEEASSRPKSKKEKGASSSNQGGGQRLGGGAAGGRKETEEEVDKILAQLEKTSKQCDFGPCKQSITLMGQKCDFCKRVYCMQHAMAEVHGCDQDMKRHARTDARNAAARIQNGILHAPPKPAGSTLTASEEVKRKQLQNKLKKSLDEKQTERKVQPKKK